MIVMGKMILNNKKGKLKKKHLKAFDQLNRNCVLWDKSYNVKILFSSAEYR